MKPSSPHPNRAAASHRLAPPPRGQPTSRLQRWRFPRLLATAVLLFCCCDEHQHDACGQSSGTADDSVPETMTDDSRLALCREMWALSDADLDGRISRSEYINWVINYSPYSPGCPNRQAYVSQFLGNASLAAAFDSLACLCQSYGANASCCDAGDPHLEMPTAQDVPSSYATTVCQTIDRALDEQCRNESTSSTTANGTSSSSGTNNGTAASEEEEEPPTSLNLTTPIVFGDGSPTGGSPEEGGSSTPDGAPEEGEDGQGGEDSQQKQRMLVQVVLPLLLVSAAAVFMAVTIVMYQRRKYASSTGTSSPAFGAGWGLRRRPKAAASRGIGDRDPTDGAEASSTDSDEEAVAGDDDDDDEGDSLNAAVTATEAAHRRRAARRSRRESRSTLIDVDTGAPVARPKSAAAVAAKTRRHSSRRRNQAPASSLLDSAARRLEPLREVQEEGDDDEEEDEDGTASHSDRAVVTEALSSPSPLTSGVSFCDDDDDDDDDDDEQDGGPQRQDDGAADEAGPTSALLLDLCVPRGSLDPPSSLDETGDEGVEAGDRRDADLEGNREAGDDGDAVGRSATGSLQPSDVAQPQPEGDKVVFQIPEAVIRRTKDNDESFDEVSL